MASLEFTPEELQSEEWRAVVGYEGWYSVSCLGRVRRDKAAQGTQAGRILKVILNPYGYLVIGLNRSGQYKQAYVHVLVAHAFIGPCPEGMEVNHKDTSLGPITMKQDCRAGNLEYVTSQGNMDHARIHGLLACGDRHGSRLHPERLVRGNNHYLRKCSDKVRGENNGRAKLTDDTVRAIRTAVGLHREIAQAFGISRPRVSAIKRGESWRHIK